jgi:hypothetical protein
MSMRDDPPLQIGDTVIYNTFGMGIGERATGVLVGQLGSGHWRVKWSNHDEPTTHRSPSLRKIESYATNGEASKPC